MRRGRSRAVRAAARRARKHAARPGPTHPFTRIRAPLASLAGYLVSVDSYMNLQLASTEEWIDGQFSGNLGEVLIRCNNVLYLRGVPEEDE